MSAVMQQRKCEHRQTVWSGMQNGLDSEKVEHGSWTVSEIRLAKIRFAMYHQRDSATASSSQAGAY